MASLYSVKVDTPEEFRDEIVAHLRRSATAHRAISQNSGGSARARKQAADKADILDYQADFIAAIKIERKS